LSSAKPPARSPYNVAYPTESSDLFPVATTSQPNLFESAISSTPRIRACRFSSAMSGSRPAKLSANAASADETIPSIGSSRKSLPSLSASKRASCRVSADE
jgi:hypothetical protein